jgi:hypothetical protein
VLGLKPGRWRRKEPPVVILTAMIDLLVMRRILFQPSPQLETAIQKLQADIKIAGPDITRTQALRFFSELGRERWCEQKQAGSKIYVTPKTT